MLWIHHGFKNILNMFNECINLSGEITLDCNITEKDNAKYLFDNAATADGAKITAKYT